MSNNPVPRLSLRNITKEFPGVRANDDVSLDLYGGEIHALLGENGAGKSTLVKIIDGLLQADHGELKWNGQTVQIQGPKAARQLGIGMVFQHFSLFEAMTVAENIALGLDQRIPLDQLEQRIGELASQYGLSVEPRRAVHTLSVGERQRVEIIRCLLQQTNLLILDEPTSVLTPQEAQALFITLRQLRDEGCAILYISHKLHEIQELCDKATILRGGKVVAKCDPKTANAGEMAVMMIGDALAVPGRSNPTLGGTLLQVQALSMRSIEPYGTHLKDISLQVRAGEVMGIAGVAGNGQSELLKALSGEQRCAHPTQIQIDGHAAGHLRPGDRRELGLACIPEDRLAQGAVAGLSLAENLTLTTTNSQQLSRAGVRLFARASSLARSIIQRHDVRCQDEQALAESLSGGNLQKFITGRELAKTPKVLVAAHPTWGVDAGAASAIHQALLDLADAGAAVLVISQELDELMAICDQIAVIAQGRLGPAQASATLTAESIGLQMSGPHGH